jgi:TRAP-type C4-dicarboxylate transport system permease small subunit
MVVLITACLLVVSFVMCLFSWIVVSRDSDPATKTLRRGSIVVVIIWMLGFVSYVLVD